MQLSKHFTLEEFEKSQTATRKGITNKAGSGEIKNLTDLCYEVLEPVRAKFDKPIIITSGYRSPELCEAIGSKATSQHSKGEAVDFELPIFLIFKLLYGFKIIVILTNLYLNIGKMESLIVVGFIVLTKRVLIENKY